MGSMLERSPAEGSSGVPLRQGILFFTPWGVGGASCTEKALKSPPGVAFFKLQKPRRYRRSAEAKPPV
jgi:hypothetical protein